MTKKTKKFLSLSSLVTFTILPITTISVLSSVACSSNDDKKEIEFNNDILFNTIATTAKTIKPKDWNKNNRRLQNSIIKGLNQASKNQISFVEFKTITINNKNSSGTVSFKITNSSKLKNYKLNFNGKTKNVAFDNDIFTISNLILSSKSDVLPPSIQSEKINFNKNELFNIASIAAKGIEKQNWNKNNNILKDALINAINEASFGELNFVDFVSTNTNNNFGSVSFKIKIKNDLNNQKVNIDFFNENNNISYSSNNNTFTINNLSLFTSFHNSIEPNGKVYLDNKKFFDLLDARTVSMNVNDWGNNIKLEQVINECLAQSSNNQMVLSKIDTVTTTSYSSRSNPLGLLQLLVCPKDPNINTVYILNNDFQGTKFYAVSANPPTFAFNIFGLKLAYTPESDSNLIVFDSDKVFKNVNDEAIKFSDSQWTLSNDAFKQAISRSFSAAFNNKNLNVELLSAEVKKSNNTGRITFQVAADFQNMTKFINSNNNVLVSLVGNLVIIDNLKLKPVSNPPKILSTNEIMQQYFPNNLFNETKNKIEYNINEIENKIINDQRNLQYWIKSAGGELSKFAIENGVLKIIFHHKTNVDLNNPSFSYNSSPETNIINFGDKVRVDSYISVEIDFTNKQLISHGYPIIFINNQPSILYSYSYNYGSSYSWFPPLNFGSTLLNNQSFDVVLNYLKHTGDIFNLNYNPKYCYIDVVDLNKQDENKLWKWVNDLIYVKPKQDFIKDEIPNKIVPQISALGINWNSNDKSINFEICSNIGVGQSWWCWYKFYYDQSKQIWIATYDCRYNFSNKNPAQIIKYGITTDQLIAFLKIIVQEKVVGPIFSQMQTS